MNTETIPQRMINAVTGESHVIQLLPKEGLTAAEVAAYLADLESEAKLINPENCETTWWYAEVLDRNGMFAVPEQWSCIGRHSFVRNLPDGSWVSFGDLPKATKQALE